MKKLLLLLAVFPAFSREIVLEKVKVVGEKIEEEEVIAEKTLKESISSKDAGEFLSNYEGIWKVRKGGIANDIVIRGFQGENVNVLVDEGRIYRACPNRMDPSVFHVDFEEIEKIEIIKGPYDVKNYGSLGGTVNIKTKEPKKGFHGKFKLTVGSFEYFNPSEEISYKKDNYFVLFGHSYRYSKPYKTGEGKRFTEYPSGINAYKQEKIDSTAFSINTFWVKTGVSFDKNKSLKISYTGQRARDVLYPYLMMDAKRDDTDRINVQFKFSNLKLTAYYTFIDHVMNNLKRVNPMFMETVAESETYGIKVLLENKNFSLGAEAFNWNWKTKTVMGASSQYTIPDVDFINIGIFGEYKKKLSKKLKFKGGIRIDTTETVADRNKANTQLYYIYHNTRDTYERDTYPSGNVQFFYSYKKNLEFFFKLGYGVRVPNAQERYFALDRMKMAESRYGDWVGNPDLKPSKNTQADLGFSFKTKKLKVKANIFFSYVQDFITVYNQPAVNLVSTDVNKNTFAKSYTNVDARFFGGEASLKYFITPKISLFTGVSYVKGEKDTDPAKNITDKDVAEIPPLKVRAVLRYEDKKKFVEIEGIASATQYNVDSDLNEEKTSGWAILNLKGGYRHKGMEIIAGINNVFDKFYYEHLSYIRDPFATGTKVPEPGRSIYLSFAYRF